MSGYINDEDIFLRTKLGSEELADRQSASIPREARTLLIMIDGRKNYTQISAMLDQRSQYRNTGVRPFMQMLVDLNFVVCQVGTDLGAVSGQDEVVNSNHLQLSDATAIPEQTTALSERTDLTGTAILNEMRANALLNTLDGNGEVVLTTKAYTQDVADHRSAEKTLSTTEALRDIISSLINKHAELEQARIYKRRLANCQDMRSIFELIQEMQRASSDEFELALYMTALAFKKSKISKPGHQSPRTAH